MLNNYDPIKSDYKIWLVINPAKWLMPILMAVLAVAVVIHLAVISSPKYNFLSAPAKVAATK